MPIQDPRKPNSTSRWFNAAVLSTIVLSLTSPTILGRADAGGEIQYPQIIAGEAGGLTYTTEISIVTRFPTTECSFRLTVHGGDGLPELSLWINGKPTFVV